MSDAAILKQASHFQEHTVRVLGTFMGLDLSLTSTGIGMLTPTGVTSTVLKTDATKVKGLARLALIVGAIVAQVEKHRPEAVGLEGYSMNSQSQAHSIGELGGLVKMELAKLGIPVLIVPPNTLKKVITGSGKGKGKGPMMLALMKRFGVEIDEDNMCDGTCLAFTAALRAGALPEANLPAANMEGLKGCEPMVSPFPGIRRREKMVQPVATG